MASLSGRMFGEYYTSVETIIDVFGKERFVEDLDGEDFEQLRARFAGLAMVTVSKRVTIARSVFQWAFSEEQKLISRPVTFGTGSRSPARKIFASQGQHAAAR